MIRNRITGNFECQKRGSSFPEVPAFILECASYFPIYREYSTDLIRSGRQERSSKPSYWFGTRRRFRSLPALLDTMSFYLNRSQFFPDLLGIRKKGGIQLQIALKGFGKIDRFTEDIWGALEKTEFIFLPMPSFTKGPCYEICSPRLKEAQKVILIPVNFGSMEMLHTIQESGRVGGVTLAETYSLLYACKQIEPGLVDVWGVKTYLSIAAVQAEQTETLLEWLRPGFLIPLAAARNVLEIALSNANMIVHCPTNLMNAGWIESTGGELPLLYRRHEPLGVPGDGSDGPGEVCSRGKCGLRLITVAEWLQKTYGLQGESLHKLLSTSPVYGGHGADAAKNRGHRYITEDIPFPLVPVVSLGEAAWRRTQVIRSIIRLADTVSGTDFYQEGRNPARMGLAGMDVDRFRQVEQARKP